LRGRSLGGWADEPPPGAPGRLADEQIGEGLVAPWERHPADATHWSRASMAAETGLSKSTVGRIWKAFGLKPHLVDTFKISNDPQFIDKVRDERSTAWPTGNNRNVRYWAGQRRPLRAGGALVALGFVDAPS